VQANVAAPRLGADGRFHRKAFWYLRPGMDQVTAAEGVSEHLRVIGGFRLRPVRDEQEPR
jgi:hypothetical protein